MLAATAELCPTALHQQPRRLCGAPQLCAGWWAPSCLAAAPGNKAWLQLWLQERLPGSHRGVCSQSWRCTLLLLWPTARPAPSVQPTPAVLAAPEGPAGWVRPPTGLPDLHQSAPAAAAGTLSAINRLCPRALNLSSTASMLMPASDSASTTAGSTCCTGCSCASVRWLPLSDPGDLPCWLFSEPGMPEAAGVAATTLRQRARRVCREAGGTCARAGEGSGTA